MRLIARRPRLLTAAWVVLAVLALPLAANVTHHLSSSGFEDPASAAVWANNQVAHLSPPPAAEPLLIQHLAWPRVKALANQTGLSRRQLHRLPSGAVLWMPAEHTSLAESAQFSRRVRRAGGGVSPVNADAAGREVVRDARRTLSLSGVLAIPPLIVLLLWVFGSVASALLPLIVALGGAEVALAVVDVLENHITLSVYLTDIVSFLALGVGIDYALFISSRFRSELDRGASVSDALTVAMSRAGRSVFYSGLAVALAIATLVLGGTAYWRGLALGGAVAVLATLLATHSLLPAVLAWAGPRVHWGTLPHRRHASRFWPWVGQTVARHPWPALALGVLVLLVPARLGVHLVMSTPANVATMLPPSSPQRQAVAEEQRLAGAGSIAPVALVATLPTTVDQPATWRTVARLTTRIQALPNVAQVASPTTSGLPPALLAKASAGSVGNAALANLLAHFIRPRYNPHLVAVFVTPRSGPDQPATLTLISRLQAAAANILPRSARFGVGGITAALNTFNRLAQQRLPWILAAVALVAFGVLFVATGSLLQALFGVVFDGLVALATAGILVYVVQYGHLGFEPTPLDSSITPLIFALLFGLSMDYEVILLHRIQEILHGGRDGRHAAGEGLAGTGGMITGAGLIMIVVFAALLISPLQIMRTLGLGLAAAILLDTWVVRTVLVPASIALLKRAAFWPFGARAARRKAAPPEP
jgi:uncharacterized membrane protein YdfJ with MMPL/SSD domain